MGSLLEMWVADDLGNKAPLVKAAAAADNRPAGI
jgi:hypothetical protein